MYASLPVFIVMLFPFRMLLLLRWDQSRDFPTTTGSGAGPTCSDTRSSSVPCLHSAKAKIKLSLLASVYYGLANARYVPKWIFLSICFYFSSQILSNDRQVQLTWLSLGGHPVFFTMNHGFHLLLEVHLFLMNNLMELVSCKGGTV
jgi:hypothetical protein